jgi:F-type H+-transporting ATPase subunit alpha
MAVSLFAANEGYLDDVDSAKIVDFEAALQGYMKSSQADLMNKINTETDYNDEVANALHAAIRDFKENNTW